MVDTRKYRICASPDCQRKIYGNGVSTIIPKYCPNCQYKMAISKQKEGKIRKRRTKCKKTERQKAMANADAWFSRFIRVRDAFFSNGVWCCRCYTCSHIHSITKIQCGHWQRRGYKTVRFHPDNARPQCLKCNYYESGKPEIFELNLIKDIGEVEVARLKELAQEVGEDNEIFYKEQVEIYKKATNKIMKLKGIPRWWK